MHKRTDSHPTGCHDRNAADCRDTHMVFIVGLGIVTIAVGFIHRMRLRGGAHSASLGWMSEQWLAEHRASHSR